MAWGSFGSATRGDSSGSDPWISASRSGNLYGDSSGGGGGPNFASLGGEQWNDSGMSMLGAARGAFGQASQPINNPFTTDVANQIAGVGRENVSATYSGRRRGLIAARNAGRIGDGEFQAMMGQLQRNESGASASQSREPYIEQARSAQSFALQEADLQARNRAQMLSGYTALLSLLRKPVGAGGKGRRGGRARSVRGGDLIPNWRPPAEVAAGGGGAGGGGAGGLSKGATHLSWNNW